MRADGEWAADGTCSASRKISLVEFREVELFATVYKPPALWVGNGAASFQIPTWACERWEEPIPNGELPCYAGDDSIREVPLSYHNFDQIPGAFVLFVGPDRNTKWSRIAGSISDVAKAGNADVATNA